MDYDEQDEAQFTPSPSVLTMAFATINAAFMLQIISFTSQRAHDAHYDLLTACVLLSVPIVIFAFASLASYLFFRVSNFFFVPQVCAIVCLTLWSLALFA